MRSPRTTLRRPPRTRAKLGCGYEASRPQACTGLARPRVGDQPPIPHPPRRPPHSPIQQGVHIGHSGSARPRHLSRHPVIEVTRHWPPHCRHPDQLTPITDPYRELHTSRRPTMPMMRSDKRTRLPKSNRHDPQGSVGNPGFSVLTAFVASETPETDPNSGSSSRTRPAGDRSRLGLIPDLDDLAGAETAEQACTAPPKAALHPLVKRTTTARSMTTAIDSHHPTLVVGSNP